MEIFDLKKVRNIVVINSNGDTVHKFQKNYLEVMENNGKKLIRKHNTFITWLPIKPKKIRKWRVIDCFIWDGDLYLLDSFINFKWIASQTLYGLENFHAVKVFQWTFQDLQEQIISDCYAYISKRRPEKFLIEKKVKELADKGIAISSQKLAEIMQYYNLVEKQRG